MHVLVSYAELCCLTLGLRTLLEVKRPVEYDARLQPLTDVSAESYG